jgi:SAM-dependent methyltransferase
MTIKCDNWPVTAQSEYGPAAEYIHLLSEPMWTELHGPLADVLSHADPDAGTVLELGAGTGLGTDVILDTIPRAPVLLAEPSPQLRAALLARLAARSDRHRITVYPGEASDVPLPDRIAAVVGMHMIGHLNPTQRSALFRSLAPRLTPGAPVVFTVQPPDTAVEVPAFPPLSVAMGALRYEGTGQAVPTGPESIRWTMTYRTLDGDAPLSEAITEYDWWIVSAPILEAELSAAGMTVTRTDESLVIAWGAAADAKAATVNHPPGESLLASDEASSDKAGVNAVQPLSGRLRR